MFIVKIKRSSFYQIVYEVNGKKTSKSTGTANRTEAEKIFEEFKKSFIPPTQEKILPNEKDYHTLSEFKKEYLEFLQPIKSKRYITSIELSFNQFISFCGDILLKQINTQIIDRFISTTFARTQRGAHQYYRTLKAAFNKAIEWNYIAVNLFAKVKFPRLTKVYPVFLTEDDLIIILTNTPYQYLKDIFTVAFYTGMRLGELINLQWNWIDFFKNQITVKCSDEFVTKSKKERIVPLSEKVKAVLTTRYQNSEHQFNQVVFYRQEGRMLHQETISKQFKDVVRKSNLNEKFHFHSLQHSFASLLVQRGVSLYVVKELLGHEDLATTQIYSHLQQQNLRDAVNLL
ncbi:MAG: tyrosine-type recombinase/integrase [Melioribacter sp.]|nr:tyrosine-type recombinase/integrase [Melioribacter sp.]